MRSGEHIVKALVPVLALGETAVAVGRRYAYGLALGGDDGIVHVLRSLLAQADLLMAIDGYPTIADLDPDALRAGLNRAVEISSREPADARARTRVVEGLAGVDLLRPAAR